MKAQWLGQSIQTKLIFPKYIHLKTNLLILWVCLLGSLSSTISVGSDESIPSFEKGLIDEVLSWDDYINPFLITQSYKKYPIPANEMEGQIRARLKKGRLDVKTLFSREGSTAESFSIDLYQLPKEISEEQQADAINTCTIEKCLMKLRNRPEAAQLQKSKNKTEAYRRLIFERIKAFLLKREILGYEDRRSNVPYFTKMVNLIPTLSKNPSTQAYLRNKFFKNPEEKGHPVDSWIRQEVVIIAPDQMQPILRVSEDCEFRENETTMFFEGHIYTSHYFDSSLVLYEVRPNPKNRKESMVVITDVMEIDELKKSAVIRALFKGKMVKAVVQFQTDFLESLPASKSK